MLVVFTSGCTDICIPGLPCGTITVDQSDILLFGDVTVFPQEVSPGQNVKVIAYVRNMIDSGIDDWNIKIYDKCEGVFDFSGIPECGGGTIITDNTVSGCDNVYIPAKIAIPIRWTLSASNDVKLKTSCDIGLSASYTVKDITKSQTKITFISSEELINSIDSGTEESEQQEIAVGKGPIKPYLVVEDEQPILIPESEDGSFLVSFQLKNQGNGRLDGNEIVVDNDNIKFFDSEIGIADQLNICLESLWARDCGPQVKCLDLIGKQSQKYHCKIEINKLDSTIREKDISTVFVRVEIKNYDYEIRKEVTATVQPQPLI